ncbi:unnamed protein product [Calypogeia fissa]
MPSFIGLVRLLSGWAVAKVSCQASFGSPEFCEEVHSGFNEAYLRTMVFDEQVWMKVEHGHLLVLPDEVYTNWFRTPEEILTMMYASCLERSGEEGTLAKTNDKVRSEHKNWHLVE